MNIQRNIYVEKVDGLPIEAQPVELVERKGVGHPDSICDAIMEATSVKLCREYQERFGRILHHNREVAVWLCSQIGKPIDQPLIAEAQLILEPEVLLEDVRDLVIAVIDRELEGIQSFTQRLARGELSVC
jgi:S-adenosylmethionine synthetase